MTPAEEITAAVQSLRSQHTTAADLARLRVPVTRWMESWEGVDLDEAASWSQDAEHALAVARAINGSQR